MLEFTNKNNIRNSIVIAICMTIFCFSCSDDDALVTDIIQFPRISAVNTQVAESEGVAKAMVKLSWAYDQQVKVDYFIGQLEDASAEDGSDFTAQSGNLVFEPGETEKVIEVNLVDDSVGEPDEIFTIYISNAILGEIISATGFITILNDDEGFFVDDSGPTSPTEYPGYNLVWSDEFDSETINTDNWCYDIGGNGWGNQELEFYTDSPSNSFQAEGYLVIEAREESMGGNDYTSARMKSEGKKEFQYGRIDIRAKLPEGRGVWPALWMLGANFSTLGWPMCGEIDIMELVGHQPSVVYGTAHYGPNAGQRQFKGGNNFLAGEKFSDQFHVFSIIWEENSIKWFRDGIQFFQLTPDVVAPYEWRFNAPQFFIMNVAVGGQWPGNPDETTTFPQQMIVDYIRVFQQ